MKKRIMIIALAVMMTLGSMCLTAGATTRRSYLDTWDKWQYDTSIWHWSYWSNYYNPWRTHWTSVRNNKTGAYQQGRAAAGGTAKASVKANFIGKPGTARIWR